MDELIKNLEARIVEKIDASTSHLSEQINSRMDKLTKRMDGYDNKIKDLETKTDMIDQINVKIGALETSVKTFAEALKTNPQPKVQVNASHKPRD